MSGVQESLAGMLHGARLVRAIATGGAEALPGNAMLTVQGLVLG